VSEKIKEIIVTVGDDALNNIHQLADQLAAKGMKVDRVMPVTGVIAGSCAATKMPDLEKVDGVTSVEEEVVASLSPPGSNVQ
jgi:hypothetical protein